MNEHAAGDTHPLAGLVRGLAAQLAHYPLLADNQSNEAEFLAIIQPRLQVLQLLLALPPTATLGRQALAGQPFIYNTALWPADAPPAGYYQAEGGLSPDAQVMSRVLMWYLQYQATSYHAGAQRMLRAALWIVKEQGVLPAIAYLLALQKQGFVFDSRATHAAIATLLEVRRRVPADPDIVAALIDLDSVAAKGWVLAEMREPAALQTPPMRELSDDIDSIVQWAEAEIDAVVQARNYDEWMLGQLFLREAMNITRSLLEGRGLWDALAYAASAVRIEEVRADAFAIRRMVRRAARAGAFAYAADFTPARAVAGLLAAKTSDWRERLFEERALVPAALAPLLLSGAGVDEPAPELLPPEWRMLSAAFVPTYAARVTRDPHYAIRRRTPVPRADAESGRLAQAYFEAQGITAPSLQSAWLTLATADAATGLAARKNQQEALATLLATGIEQDALDALDAHLNDLCLKMTLAELDRHLNDLAAVADSGPAAALALWQRFAEHYPYFHPGLQEQAVALDRLQRPQEALPLLRDAILLQPWEPLPWHALAVVLKHLGCEEASVVCLLASQQLAGATPAAAD